MATEEKAKHVPSPYEIADETFVYALNEQGTNSFCATIQYDRRTPREQVVATARLFRAAPDLFEACQAVKDKLDYLCNLWGAEGVTRSVIQKLEDALSKATQ